MDLAEFVERYTQLSERTGAGVHLSQFGLSKKKTEKLVSDLDDDYQISRYIVLFREPDEELLSYPSDSRVYSINGFEVSHVFLAPGIREIL